MKPVTPGRKKIAPTETKSMPVTKISIFNLKPDKENPRKDLAPEDAERKAITKSLKKYGLVDPIVIDSNTGIIISGHQRIKVLQEKGVTELNLINLGGVSWAFPDEEIPKLNAKDRKTLMIGLNKISGLWDYPGLTSLFKELSKETPIEELADSTGFTEFETKNLLATPDVDVFFGKLDEIPADEPKGLSELPQDGKAKKPVRQFVICPNCQQEIEL